MKKAWRWYVGFFVLLFTGYFTYLYFTGDISQSSLPVINDNIQPFSFTNQNNKTITQRNVDGKVYVTEFFFTSCKGICPKMNTNMRRVYDVFKNEPNFAIISHTCMPETDSVPELKKYEQKMLLGKLIKTEQGTYKIENDSTLHESINPQNAPWYFVTGDKSSLYKAARYSYLLDNNKTEDTTVKMENQFIHTQLFALVDKQARVRAIYDGLKEDEIQKLITDIRSLLKENNQNRSLKGF
jgi:protein SCO1/2